MIHGGPPRAAAREKEPAMTDAPRPKIVSGAKRPSREVLARLCKHLGLTLTVTVQITVD